MRSSPRPSSRRRTSRRPTPSRRSLIRGVRQVSTPAGPVLFASGTQSTNTRNIVKYLALLKGDKTVLVTFNIADRGFSEADAEAVLRSVQIAPAPTLEERLAGMPFTFEAIEPFRVTNVDPPEHGDLGAGRSGRDAEPGSPSSSSAAASRRPSWATRRASPSSC